MTIFIYTSYFIVGIYTAIIISFFVGWYRLKSHKDKTIDSLLPVSVVIACRNEENVIKKLLQNLINQNYPKEKLEIMIVNDHSVDNTSDIISEFSKNNDCIKLFNLPDKKQGKKDAIDLGIHSSKHDIIVTTDADCTMNPDWLRKMVESYIQKKPKVLSGPVTFNKGNFFQNLQILEFLSLVGSGAGSIGINRAIMCNGANLLFEKQIYLKSNIKRKTPSGDDIFLMLSAKKENRKAIAFCKSKSAIVYTDAPQNISNFVNQRFRWTSKSKLYTDFDIILTALIVALTNLSIVILFVLSFQDQALIKPLLYLIAIKSITDLIFLIPVSSFFNQAKTLWLFLPVQVLYPFYIVFTSIGGLLGNFYWKNRKFNLKG